MRRILEGALALVLLLGLSTGVLAAKDEQAWNIREQGIERPAPDFTLPDLDGVPVTLTDLRGKVVLVVFTTTWCPYCKKELPYLKELYDKRRTDGLEILAIYIQESPQKVASFAARYGLPYRVLLDTTGQVARAYGVRGVPTRMLIDKDGVVRCVACRSLEIMLEELLP